MGERARGGRNLSVIRAEEPWLFSSFLSSESSWKSRATARPRDKRDKTSKKLRTGWQSCPLICTPSTAARRGELAHPKCWRRSGLRPKHTTNSHENDETPLPTINLAKDLLFFSDNSGYWQRCWERTCSCAAGERRSWGGLSEGERVSGASTNTREPGPSQCHTHGFVLREQSRVPSFTSEDVYCSVIYRNKDVKATKGSNTRKLVKLT